jgi:F-type H+-transporting ATPase subunit delta
VAEVATIARPYAEAAFELADKSASLPAWSDALAALAQAAQDPEMQRVLGNPRVPDAKMVEMFSGVAAGAPQELQRLLQALAENKRLSVLPEMREQFERLRAEREGTVDAKIESAFPMAGDELKSLVADLERRFKRKVRAHVVHDPELIGGARISVGDQVIDGSIRGKLTAMAAGLMSA